ncbi:MAG TPA: hypothetical protein VN025_18240 [Candidatus Dormibacteraeota bacterium]|nr:hypothetical protein [Candidatus Dormibacteraeota bacterium]
MPARNCNAARVLVTEKKVTRKSKTSFRTISDARGILAVLLTVMTSALFAPRSVAQEQAASAQEVQQLRNEVKDLKESVKRLETLLESRSSNATGQPAVAVTNPVVDPAPETGVQSSPAAENVQSQANKPASEETGLPQYTGRSTDPGVAMATKAHGGDLSGAGNLLRTERVAIGGYGDFQFRTPSLNERADGGGSGTFQSTRFVLGVAAVLSQKQNITLNSEIEYELGTSEIDVEQAFLSWRVRPEFDFRAGIIVPPIGRFNTYHDSNLNIMTLRPLINQYIIPTAYRDAGLGVRGVFRLPREMKLSYEADVVNGFQAANADGEATPFSRIYGQSSAAEPGLIAFQATRNTKAVAGRVGFSPILGLEFGISTYAGTFTNQDDPKKSATIVFFDASYQRGPFVLNGEYGRSNIVGAGIARQSAPPPTVNPNDPLSIAALGNYVAQTSPGQDGFYVESGYKFFRGIFRNREKFDEGAYLMPVVRFEAVRRDRTLSDFYLNESRSTLGLNVAPSPSVIFKLNYVFNHTFGKVPNLPGVINGGEFGADPIPFRDYGKNGFTGSVAYVF